MANPEHLAKLMQGVEPWNQWRKHAFRAKPDLRSVKLVLGEDFSGADLSKADLFEADLSGADLTRALLSWANLGRANLRGANLSGANLGGANLRGADLRRADFTRAYLEGVDLSGANLGGANLRGVDLSGADLFESNLSGANLSGANLGGAMLIRAILVGTNLEGANLTACWVHGISAWNVRLEGAIQANLVITRADESAIQVDNLEVAQFVYLLLNNDKIRQVIDTITSKVVLILGRFTPERKIVLDAIRRELRKRDYLPVLFDFEKPASKDLTGTISTLANMARFIIADLTDPSSVPHEVAMIVPSTVVPVQPILLEGQREFAMFVDLKTRYHWVLEPYQYKSEEQLIVQLRERVIAPAEGKAKELARK